MLAGGKCKKLYIYPLSLDERKKASTPGSGTLDFKPGFQALKEIEYKGFIEIESRQLSGKAEVVLPCSREYLTNLWASA
jgi:sugar phosphate isomerase/epimerase